MRQLGPVPAMTKQDVNWWIYWHIYSTFMVCSLIISKMTLDIGSEVVSIRKTDTIEMVLKGYPHHKHRMGWPNSNCRWCQYYTRYTGFHIWVKHCLELFTQNNQNLVYIRGQLDQGKVINTITRITSFNPNFTFKTIAAPVECPKQKHGRPGFSATTFSRNDFCTEIKKNI